MTNRPRVLIEEWFPIETVGCESMRDASAARKPPLNRLHVWWARRPLTASRAALLASLLPTWSDSLARFLKEREAPFLSAEEYQEWFIRLCGIFGDPVAGRERIRRAKQQGIRLKTPPYTHKRAFTVNPASDQLQILKDLLRHTWGKGHLSLLDPFAGGGSIPFEAVRYGFDTSANELNPVAGAVLRGTLQYPFALGSSLAADIRRWGKRLTDQLGDALSLYYPEEPTGSVHAYLWARTVACPYTGKPVPLAPNWWLARSGASGAAILPDFDPDFPRVRFRVVKIKDGAGPGGFDPGHGTVRHGKGRSPWADDQVIEGDYIKAEAQAGRMGSQLYCVAVKKPRGGFDFRPLTDEDIHAVEEAEAELARKLPLWDARGWVQGHGGNSVREQDR